MTAARAEFALDFAGGTHLNHGSFGAVPRRVMAAQDRIRERVEQNPHRFLRDELPGELRANLLAVRRWLGADDAGSTVVPVRNASEGVSTVVRAVELSPGDEVLALDTEYPSLIDLWRDRCAAAGAALRVLPVAIGSDVAAAQQVADALTSRTRAVFVSHVNSVLSTVTDLEAVQAAVAGTAVLVVDGAHAPGQIESPLRGAVGDFYVGNLHKWALFPRGTGFVHAASSSADGLRPLVRSWYWADPSVERRFSWQGTSDPSPWLVADVVVELHREAVHRGWVAAAQRVRDRAVGLLSALGGVSTATALSPHAPHMASVAFPGVDAADLKQALRRRDVWTWVDDHDGHAVLRVSCPWYVEDGDVDVLEDAVRAHLGSL